jgi:cyclopropane-fatty-acyl-phospholipid synthase
MSELESDLGSPLVAGDAVGFDDALPSRARGLDAACRRIVLAAMSQLSDGELVVRENGAAIRLGRPGGLTAEVTVRDPRFWRQVALGGSIGTAEAFMAGTFVTPDLVGLLRLVVRNRPALLALERTFEWVGGPWQRLAHWLRANTRRGSRRNIAAHYDLGNEFFELFLDPTMMYSSAVFTRPEMTLEEAQLAKLDRLCRRLDLQPGERVVEIGTGWGGFAEHAARHYGAHVTTTTISPAQLRFARERVAAAGLADRVEVLDLDYRDLPAWASGHGGRFDKLVSIEMIEAVGHRFLDTFFAVCSDLLVPHGRMALQAITIRDAFYERALRSVDFIQRYIFPGSFIPSIGALTAAVARSTDLVVTHLEDIGPSYAETLRNWRQGFLANRDAAHRQGFPESFLRLWELYFAYCEAGFRERTIGDAQIILDRPGARPVVPV